MAYQNDTNTWHDNASYDAALEFENACIDEINRLIDIKLTAQMVSKHYDPNLIDIGDVVTLRKNGEECFDVKLTGKYRADLKNDEITMNSPIGSIILKKKIGEKISFILYNEKFIIEIINIKKEEKYEN